MKQIRFILSAMLLMACSIVQAHDFVVTIEGQKVYFNVKSKTNRTAEVTYNGSIVNGLPSYYEGELTIPDKVKHNNTVYSVVGISAKAFSGADKLTGIIMPSGISVIGDFAFEGCTSLSKIIFPGNDVKFGQGVFFKCNKIQNISLGSDWKEIDLKMFRWSDSLDVITIPAKIVKIQNMKSLKNLKSISVDINNARFTGIDGLLYNKNADILYGCPRAYAGAVQIAAETKEITRGALADCKGITRIDLPESIVSVSFREFSRLDNLEEIVFRSTTPIMTAKSDGKEVFLLQTASPDVKIIVLKSAKNGYASALVQQSGEYTETDGTTPFLVEKAKMPDVKNIIGVKNF